MKLSSKIQMFEEFNSTEKDAETAIDSKGAVTTTPTTTILDDVDHILGDLETLSKQIDENIDEAIDLLTNDFLNDAINEATAAETMMQVFKDMGSIAKLQASYKKMAATKASIETDKKIFGYKFTAEKPERVAKAKDKLKDKLNDAIKDEKDPAKKQRLRKLRDTKLKVIEQQISDKIDREKQDQDKKFDRDLVDAQSAITKLIGDNKITSPIMSPRWESKKLDIDRNIEDANIAEEREAIDTFIEDEERQKRLEDAALEREKKSAAEANKRLEQAKADAEEAQTELDSKIANAQGDEKVALDKLKEWNDAYLDFSDKMNLTKESTSEEKKAARDASTRFNNADEALGKKTMKDAFGYTDDLDINNALSEFNERAEALKSEFNAIKTTAGVKSSDDSEPTPEPDPEPTEDTLTDDQTTRIASEEEQRDQRQQELDAELAKPEAERNQQKIQGLENGIRKNEEDIDAIRNEAPTESVSTSDFDQSITESHAFKSGSVADRFRRLI